MWWPIRVRLTTCWQAWGSSAAAPASARQRRARAGRGAWLQRSALRTDCLAVLGLMARRRTHFVAAQLRSNSGAESVNEARCARGHEPCAPQRFRRRATACPGAPLRDSGTSWTKNKSRCLAAGGTRWGRLLWRREAQARGRRAQRASSTDSSPLFERSERSERSEFGDATSGRASECSRCAATTATAGAAAGCRLPRRAQGRGSNPPSPLLSGSSFELTPEQ